MINDIKAELHEMMKPDLRRFDSLGRIVVDSSYRAGYVQAVSWMLFLLRIWSIRKSLQSVIQNLRRLPDQLWLIVIHLIRSSPV